MIQLREKIKKNSFLATVFIVFALMIFAILKPNYTSVNKYRLATSGSCGTGTIFVLSEDGTLTISGSGRIRDYSESNAAPWTSESTYISKIVILNGITTVGDYAFNGCSNVMELTIPQSVKTIGQYSLQNCPSLANINYSGTKSEWKSITKESDWSSGSFTIHCADDCLDENGNVVTCKDHPKDSGLASFSKYLVNPSCHSSIIMHTSSCWMPCNDSLSWDELVSTSNGRKYGYNASAITQNSIGNDAFLYCSSLTSITIPSNITNIGDRAFYGCNDLTNIKIPNSVTNIGTSAFEGCSDLAQVVIPDSVTTIGQHAFYGCNGLTSVFIPLSVTSIGNKAFSYCSNISEINVDTNNQFYCSDNGVLFNKEKTILFQYPVKKVNTSYQIPEGVTTIQSEAFSKCSQLYSIGMPTSITEIGSFAFYSCTNLTNISIPNGVQAIQSYTFGQCTNLVNATIPNTVTSINGGAFSNCANLQNFTFPSNLTNIGYNAFFNCSSLENVDLPSSVTSIGSAAFSNCVGLTSVSIPNGVTRVESDTFKMCTELVEVSIPSSVTTIGSDVFYSCSTLEHIYFGGTSNGWKNISKSSSWDSRTGKFTIHCNENGSFVCLNKELDVITCSVHTPIATFKRENGTTVSVNWAELMSVDYSTEFKYDVNAISDTYIGAYAFEECDALISINIPYNIVTIGKNAFASCSNLDSVKLPTSIKRIDSNAFDGCSSLKIIHLPYSLNPQLTGNYLFAGCTQLEAITVDEDAQFQSIDGVLFNQNGTGLLAYPAGKDAASYEIPEGVTFISYSGFDSCVYLSNISVPMSVNSMKRYSFHICSALTDIDYPGTVSEWNAILKEDEWDLGTENYTVHCFDDCIDKNGNIISCPKHPKVATFKDGSSTIKLNMKQLMNIDIGLTYGFHAVQISNTSIGEFAFEDCEKLISIALPEGITLIGSYAFRDCINLTTVSTGDDVTVIEKAAFANCEKLTSITLSNNLSSIGEGAFYCCSSLTVLYLPNNVSYIGPSACAGCTKLSRIYIPGGVTEISDWTFNNCPGLTEIAIPNSIKSIGVGAFSCCVNLTGITLPSSVSSIGEQAFYCCQKLTAITIPANITRIENGTFNGCGSLTSASIPSSVNYIGDYAFQHCTVLSSLSIPVSVTSLGKYVFRFCYELKTINYGSTEAAWEGISKDSDWNTNSLIATIQLGDGNTLEVDSTVI